MSKVIPYFPAETCPQGTIGRFCQRLKSLCGGIKPAHARHGLPSLANFTGNARIPRQQAKEKSRINALRTSMAEEEKLLGLREVLFGAHYQLQGPLNLLAAAQGTLRRRNGDHQHDALIAALQEVLDSGHTALATLQNRIPPNDTETPGPVDLNQVLHETLALMADALLENGVVARWHPVAELPPLHGLEKRLCALFKQLIENAVDAMKQEGRLRRELSIFTCSDGDGIRVCIEDSGPGIPAHLCTKVFEPFFSTKAAQRHAGMGLTWVQEVVSQHGGFIQIDPEYAQGCRIHIQFPIS